MQSFPGSSAARREFCPVETNRRFYRRGIRNIREYLFGNLPVFPISRDCGGFFLLLPSRCAPRKTPLLEPAIRAKPEFSFVSPPCFPQGSIFLHIFFGSEAYLRWRLTEVRPLVWRFPGVWATFPLLTPLTPYEVTLADSFLRFSGAKSSAQRGGPRRYSRMSER